MVTAEIPLFHYLNITKNCFAGNYKSSTVVCFLTWKMRRYPKKRARHSKPQWQSSHRHLCSRRNTCERERWPGRQALNRDHKGSIQANCYQVNPVVCFPKVSFSALKYLFPSIIILLREAGIFVGLEDAQSRCVKFIFTGGTQVQQFETVLNDCTGEHTSHSKKFSLSSKKVLVAFLFGSSRDKKNVLLAQTRWKPTG